MTKVQTFRTTRNSRIDVNKAENLKVTLKKKLSKNKNIAKNFRYHNKILIKMMNMSH